MKRRKQSKKEQSLRETVLDYPICRGLNHWWNLSGIPIEAVGRHLKFTTRCRNCGGERDTYLTSRGLLVKHVYRMPDDYYLKGQRVTKAMSRVITLLEEG